MELIPNAFDEQFLIALGPQIGFVIEIILLEFSVVNISLKNHMVFSTL